MEPPKDTAGQIGVGILLIAGTTAAGAIIGRATSQPCQPNDFLCGPEWDTFTGGAEGLLVGGAIGGLLAIFSPAWRVAGLTAAGVVGALIVTSNVKAALSPAPPPSNPLPPA